MDDPCICHLISDKLDRLDNKLDERIDRLEDKMDKRLLAVEADVKHHDRKLSLYAGGITVMVFLVNIIIGALK